MVFLIHTELRCTVNHTSDLQLSLFPTVDGSQDSSVYRVARLWAGRPGNRHSITGKGKRLTPSPKHLDTICSPPTLLFKWYQGLPLLGKSGRYVRLPIQPHLVPRLGMNGGKLPHPYAFMACTQLSSPLPLANHIHVSVWSFEV